MKDEIKSNFKKSTHSGSWKSFFGYRSIVKNLPFYLFLSVIAVIYIYNGHMSDNIIRKMIKTEKNIKQLEYEYRNIKTEVIFRSKESELVKVLEPLGLKDANGTQIMIKDSVVK